MLSLEFGHWTKSKSQNKNKGDKMKKILLSVLASFSMLFAGGDIAPVSEPVAVIDCPEYESGYYAGLSGTYNYSNYATIYKNFDDSGLGGQLQAGYRWFGQDNLGLSIEGRVGTTEANNIELTYATIYLKPEVTFKEKYSVYALVGYGETETKTLIETTRVDDFTYGGGVSYKATEKVDVIVDYVSLPNLGGTETDLITLGFNYNF